MKGEFGEKQKINKINLDTVENPLCPRKIVEEEGPCNAEEKSGGEGQAKYSPTRCLEYGFQECDSDIKAQGLRWFWRD